MAEAGRGRFLQLPRRADQQPGTRSLPAPRHDPLATHAPAAKPKGPNDVGPDRSPGGGVAPQAPYPTPLAKRPLRRQTPEVGAVCIMWRRWICGADLGDRRLERLSGCWTPHNNPVDFVETHLAVRRSAPLTKKPLRRPGASPDAAEQGPIERTAPTRALLVILLLHIAYKRLVVAERPYMTAEAVLLCGVQRPLFGPGGHLRR